MKLLALSLVCVALGSTGCADSATSGEACTFHRDCPQSEVCLDGACTPGCRSTDDCVGAQTCESGRCVDQRDGTVPDAATHSGPCVPNGDDRVTRAEFRLAPGTGAPFVVNGTEEMVAVDLSGTEIGGELQWDLHEMPGEVATRQFVELWEPAAAPVGAQFPEADYMTPLTGSPGIWAFFDLGDASLRLLGLADLQGNFTLLRYSPAVTVLQFPVVVGGVWETEAVAEGSFLGTQVRVTERYRTEVRARGTADLPAGELPVIQLVTLVERSFDTAGFSQRATVVDFLAECGGFVASAHSAEGVTSLPDQVRHLELLLPVQCEHASDCGEGGLCNERGYCDSAGQLPVSTPPCVADGDGEISDDEMPVEAGLSGVFLLSDADAPIEVDVSGRVEGDGRVWDFRPAELGTQSRIEKTMDPASFWFAAQFPSATYVAVLDDVSRTLAVFERRPGELLMLGIASEVPGDTLLVYTDPMPAMRFPMAEGDAWNATTEATGMLGGSEVQLDISSAFSVDAAGVAQLPAGDVPVLRLLVENIQQVDGAPWAVGRKTYLFVAECLGGVARVVSALNEEDREFRTATEVARLTVPRCLSSLQCVAGVSCEQGLCGGVAPVEPSADAGIADAGTASDAGTSPDAVPQDAGVGPDAGPEDAGGPNPPLCNPIGDGVVTRDEVLLRPGISATFAVAHDDDGMPIDLEGVPCDEGRCWDLAGPRPGDQRIEVALRSPEELWFAGNFPGASYVTYVDRERRWFGVLRLGDDALELLGTASEEPQSMLTTYDPPIPLYRFPLREGDEWTVESTQSGHWGLTPIFTDDTYHIRVAAGGVVATPLGDIPALQVIARVEQHVPFTFLGNNQVVHTFIGECHGIVARVVSTAGEADELFTRAAQIERLAPQP